MSTDNTPLQPKINAAQALQRVLELIRTSNTAADLTHDRVEQVMGVPLHEKGRIYWFGERVAPHWSHGFSLAKDPGASSAEQAPRFDYGFSPDPLNSTPPMTDICQLDFDQFKAALQAMGFTARSVYDSPPHAPPGQDSLPHGRRMYDSFDRPGMRVQVYPEREHAPKSDTDMGRTCVKQVYIY